MYLTPERFKTMGTGIDLSEVETVALRSSIGRATAAINSFCAVPSLPQMHSFRGGTITDEEHVYPIDEWERPRPFRVWPWHSPIRAVTSLKLIWGVQGGNDTFLDIDPDNLLISDQGYVEVSSLNLSQLVFGDAVMPYIGLHNPVFRISYTYGNRFVVNDDPAEPVDAKTFQAQNQFWTDDDVVVKVDGDVVAVGFQLNRIEGWVVFSEMQDAGAEVTLSYTHMLPNEIMQACGLTVAKDLGESDLRAKGFEGLASIRVKDVELRRTPVRGFSGGGASRYPAIPEEAQIMLEGWTFRTAR